MRFVLAIVGLAGVTFFAVSENQAQAPASQAKPAATKAAQVIRARQARYKEMGRAMKGIGDELKKSSPSMPAIRTHARLMRRYALQVNSWFPRGSGPEAGVKTRAKPEIWSDRARFSQAARGFAAAANRFDGLARRGNVAAMRAAVPQLGASCKTCHDRFRAPEE